MARIVSIECPHGEARAHVSDASAPRGLLVLSHGAGGGVESPDLLAVRDAALERGVSVALVEQPYRVAGRRAPAPQRQLDANWLAIVAALRELGGDGVPVFTGGRSMGARVACRTAADVGAAGVVCLAFPLQPRPRKGVPVPDRLHELDGVGAPVLVVQGRTDAFGMPPAGGSSRTLVVVDGDHALKADVPAVAAAVGAWLDAQLG